VIGGFDNVVKGLAYWTDVTPVKLIVEGKVIDITSVEFISISDVQVKVAEVRTFTPVSVVEYWQELNGLAVMDVSTVGLLSNILKDWKKPVCLKNPWDKTVGGDKKFDIENLIFSLVMFLETIFETDISEVEEKKLKEHWMFVLALTNPEHEIAVFVMTFRAMTWVSDQKLFKFIWRVDPTGKSVGVKLTTRAEFVLVVVGFDEKEHASPAATKL